MDGSRCRVMYADAAGVEPARRASACRNAALSVTPAAAGRCQPGRQRRLHRCDHAGSARETLTPAKDRGGCSAATWPRLALSGTSTRTDLNPTHRDAQELVGSTPRPPRQRSNASAPRCDRREAHHGLVHEVELIVGQRPPEVALPHAGAAGPTCRIEERSGARRLATAIAVSASRQPLGPTPHPWRWPRHARGDLPRQDGDGCLQGHQGAIATTAKVMIPSSMKRGPSPPVTGRTADRRPRPRPTARRPQHSPASLTVLKSSTSRMTPTSNGLRRLRSSRCQPIRQQRPIGQPVGRRDGLVAQLLLHGYARHVRERARPVGPAAAERHHRQASSRIAQLPERVNIQSTAPRWAPPHAGPAPGRQDGTGPRSASVPLVGRPTQHA
jgi:hypothetical protein